MSDMLEEDYEDDTIYMHVAEDEWNAMLEFITSATDSMEWVAEEIGAVMHKGKHPTAALLAIKAVVDEFGTGMNVFTQRNMAGDVVYTGVVRP